jgi:rare lipoprotein A
MEKLTAAHRTYAFGTVVHVTNQTNGKVVEVRINDRGPFVAGRIIDLSHAAAQSIAMSSIANVRLVVTSTPRTRDLQNYAVQTGNFVDRQGAAALLEQMKGQYGEAKLIYRPGDESWRVLVGRLPSVESADSLAQQIERQTGSAFVVLLENEQ